MSIFLSYSKFIKLFKPFYINGRTMRQLHGCSSQNIHNSKIYSNFVKKNKQRLYHSTNIMGNKDDNAFNDPEMNDLIRSMYKDFEVESSKANDKTSSEEVDDSLSKCKNKDPQQVLDIKENIKSTYEMLDYDEEIIYDYDEEQILKEKGLWKEKSKKELDPDLDVTYERGIAGVFDVEELVEFLREQKAMDIVAIYVPPEMKYVNYLVIATMKSSRHGIAIIEFLVKLYKKKKHPKDRFIKSEGKGTNWLALDMGNIALHLMKDDVRWEKNLESLWTVGGEFDEESIEWENPYALKDSNTLARK